MRPILVGTDPNRVIGGEPFDPDRPSGKRLADLCGMSPATFRQSFDRINLYSQRVASNKIGDQAAGRNLASLLRGRRVLALGQRVLAAIGTPEELMSWEFCEDSFIGATMPHPSGMNRWWNDADNVAAAKAFLMKKVARPCVHVEGPEGSGKSTLATTLADHLKLELVPTENPPQFTDECRDRVVRRIQPGIVCDRSSGLISELVYGPILRDRTMLDEKSMWDAVGWMAHAVTFIYCRPPIQAMIATTRPGESPAHLTAVE